MPALRDLRSERPEYGDMRVDLARAERAPLDLVLEPRGVAVVIEASHACMTARGVRTPGVNMVTSRVMGIFRRDSKSREEVLKLMGY